MPKLGKQKRDEITALAKQMRKDDVGWDTIINDQRIKGFIKLPTLKAWAGEGAVTSTAGSPKVKRGGKVSDATKLQEALAEISRLQTLVSDLLLGKVKLQRQ